MLRSAFLPLLTAVKITIVNPADVQFFKKQFIFVSEYALKGKTCQDNNKNNILIKLQPVSTEKYMESPQ